MGVCSDGRPQWWSSSVMVVHGDECPSQTCGNNSCMNFIYYILYSNKDIKISVHLLFDIWVKSVESHEFLEMGRIECEGFDAT